MGELACYEGLQDRHMDTLRFKAAKKVGPRKDLDPEK